MGRIRRGAALPTLLLVACRREFITTQQIVFREPLTFSIFSCLLHIQPTVFHPPNKAVILSEALRRSIAIKGFYSAKSKDPGDADYQMLSGAFRPQTTPGRSRVERPAVFPPTPIHLSVTFSLRQSTSGQMLWQRARMLAHGVKALEESIFGPCTPHGTPGQVRRTLRAPVQDRQPWLEFKSRRSPPT